MSVAVDNVKYNIWKGLSQVLQLAAAFAELRSLKFVGFGTWIFPNLP